MQRWLMLACLMSAIACGDSPSDGKPMSGGNIEDTAQPISFCGDGQVSGDEVCDDACAVLTLDGLDTLMLGFSDDGVAYRLTTLTDL